MQLNLKTKSGKVEYAICIFLSLFSLIFAFYRIKLSIEKDANYEGYCIPDFLINYQGGFIRRGILGEILYQIFNIHPYPVHIFIVYSEVVVFSVFILLSCYVFYKLKYVPIMPFAILVLGLLAYRRDFLMLIIAFVIFRYIIKYVKNHLIRYLIFAQLLAIMSILIYEPSFFFTIPICMLIIYCDIDNEKSTSHRWAYSLLTFSFPIITMALVCIFKGTASQTDAVWHSWTPLFNYLNIEQPEIPKAISFLSKSENTTSVFLHHLRINYGIDSDWIIGFNPNLVFSSILFFIGIYFLTLTIPQRCYIRESNKILSNLYLFQFACLIPMFSILSCDFGRTILYVVFTSYYLLYLIISNDIKFTLPFIDKLSDKSSNLMQQIPNNKAFLLHLCILFFIPIKMSGISIRHTLFLGEYWPIIHSQFVHMYSLLGL